MTSSALKNEDFRKLLATPSASRSESKETPVLGTALHSFTHRQTVNSSLKKSSKGKFKTLREKTNLDEDDIFSESQAKLNEILSKYRDRASERRKGLTQPDDADLRSRITAAYKAVPGTASAAASLAERRKLEIQESKYLGGDIEHTHLVKGLDYSLLNKVRDEIQECEENEELEKIYELKKQENKLDEITRSKLAKNICRILLHNEPPKRNEMFSKGRMAYIVELEDEESDVPCTLLRSVVDCPSDQSNENMNADNLLINKLTQVLSYLRTDAKKRKKGDALGKEDAAAALKQKIYDDTDDYIPTRSRDQQKINLHGDRKEKTSYFECNFSKRYDDDYKRRENRDRDYDQKEQRDRRFESDKQRDNKDSREDRQISINTDYLKRSATEPLKVEQKKRRRADEEDDDAYAELYPSGIGFLDAGGESDEDADFSKMDMGNRKGPIKRWDFDTEKEYETYQESREAMPKAAYQYGVKMNGGRKTRKNNSVANEKKLDRELDKINKILDDRKKGTVDRKMKY